MYGSRVGIVTNGIRQNDQEWGPDHAPNIDLNSFESIQLIKGASALKYGGDTAGGMIILSSQRKKLTDSLYGNTISNLESNGKGGTLSSKLTRTTYNGYYMSGQFTLKRFGDLNSPKYNLSNTGLRETDFSFRFGKDKIISGWEASYSIFINETGILRAAHIGNIQDLFLAISSNQPLRIDPFTYDINSPKQHASHQNIHLSYFKNQKNKGKLELKYNYQINQRQEFDVRRGNRSKIPAIDILLKTHNVLGSFFWEKNLRWDFEIGLSGLYQDNFSDPLTGVKRLIPDHFRFELGSFFLVKYKPNNLLTWELGIRADKIMIEAQKYFRNSVWSDLGYSELFPEFEKQYFGTQILTNPFFSFLNFSAHTGISSIINEEFESSVSYVMSQRAPNSSELFSDGLHHSLATIEYGNLLLTKETTHKLLLNLSKLNGQFTGSFQPYVSKTYDYIFIEPKRLEQTIRGAFPVWEYDATDALLWGIDLNANFNLGNQLNLKSSSSYIYAQDLLNDKPIISIPSFNTLQQIEFTSKNKKWDVQFSHNFIAKQNRFPDNNFNFSVIENGNIIFKTLDISSSPKSYQLIDAMLTLHLKSRKKLKSDIRLKLQNITNSDYRDYLNRMRFYSSEIGRNFQIQLNFSY